MADRTSAALFSEIFGMLAENPTDENKRVASAVFSLTKGYDFSNYQMEAGKELELLGIAKRHIDPEYPEDGETYLYPDDDGYDEA